ncbi:39S ribosomal protein L38, mitochondrial [Balamuthia mandrillaris]
MKGARGGSAGLRLSLSNGRGSLHGRLLSRRSTAVRTVQDTSTWRAAPLMVARDYSSPPPLERFEKGLQEAKIRIKAYKEEIGVQRYVRDPNWKPEPGTEISLHTRIRKKAKLHCVFPDVLPQPFTPPLFLKVDYNDIQVRKGHVLPPQVAFNAPTVTFEDKSKGKKMYTLLMTTPDSPFAELPPPSKGGQRDTEYIHWLIMNIPGNKVDQGETIVDYAPIAPRRFSDQQRYVFLLFEQTDGKIATTDDDLSFLMQKLKATATNKSERNGFNTFRLQQEYSLVPKGLAFFKSFWNPEVGKLYQNANEAEPWDLSWKDKLTPTPILNATGRSKKYLDPTLWRSFPGYYA